MALETGRNIQELYQALQSRGVRLTHQYQLSFNIIQSDLGGEFNANDIIGERTLLKNATIWAEGAELPGRTQNTTEFTYLGFPLQVPTNMNVTQQFSTTFRSDRAMEIQRSLLKWMNAISKPVDGTLLNNFGGDKTLKASTMDIILYDDKFENVELIYTLKGIYPTSVSPIAMSNDSPSIATFNAEFTYQYWFTDESRVNSVSQDTKAFGDI